MISLMLNYNFFPEQPAQVHLNNMKTKSNIKKITCMGTYFCKIHNYDRLHQIDGWGQKQIIRFRQEEDSTTSVFSIFCLPTRLGRVSCPSRGPKAFIAISEVPVCPNLQFRWQFQNKPSTHLQPLRIASVADAILGFSLGNLCCSVFLRLLQ